VRYAILDEQGRVREEGEGGLAIDDRAATLQPLAGTPLVIPHGDVDRLEAADYRLALRFHTGETLRLSHVGPVYEQVLDRLAAFRDATLRRDLLLEREPPREIFSASVQASAWGPASPQPSRVLVYRDQVAILTNAADPVLLPFSSLAAFRAEPGSYEAALEDDDGGRAVVRKLGPRFEEFVSTVRGALGDLDRRTGESLGTLIPGLDPLSLRDLVRLCRDGRAVKESEASAVGAEVWSRLEQATIREPGLRESYDALRSIGQPGQAWIGFRPGGEEGGEGRVAANALDEESPPPLPDASGTAPESEDRPAFFCWFFVRVGRAVALEVVSEGDHATYLFRVGTDADRDVRAINRALRYLQFRREPVYAPEEELESGRLSRFRLAVRRHAPLRLARAAFLGRALHTTASAWRKAVDAAVAKA